MFYSSSEVESGSAIPFLIQSSFKYSVDAESRSLIFTLTDWKININYTKKL